MPQDERIDAYIGKAQPFARPILTHVRALMKRTLPEVDETIKWSRPFFMLDGKPLAMMAAFKAHAIFGFWRGRGEGTENAPEAGGQFGRLTSVADLPDDADLSARIREAADKARAAPASKSKRLVRPAPDAPSDLVGAFAAAPMAKGWFDKAPPGQRREYVEWIEEAKRPETRATRLTRAIAQMSEGHSLNWRYDKPKEDR